MVGQYPEVHVEDITNQINKKNEPKFQNLGETNEAFFLSEGIQKIQSVSRKESVRVLKLIWKGGKVPRGVKVGNDKEISWTQHGQVLAGDGECVGTYDRTKECTGENHDEQEMIVYLNE